MGFYSPQFCRLFRKVRKRLSAKQSPSRSDKSFKPSSPSYLPRQAAMRARGTGHSGGGTSQLASTRPMCYSEAQSCWKCFPWDLMGGQ